MKLVPTILLACVVSASASGRADAHSWYPMRCCSDNDCAPVIRSVPAPGGKWVTSIHGTVFVPSSFSAEVSQDNDAHVCMAPDPTTAGKMNLLCFFEPGIL